MSLLEATSVIITGVEGGLEAEERKEVKCVSKGSTHCPGRCPDNNVASLHEVVIRSRARCLEDHPVLSHWRLQIPTIPH